MFPNLSCSYPTFVVVSHSHAPCTIIYLTLFFLTGFLTAQPYPMYDI